MRALAFARQLSKRWSITLAGPSPLDLSEEPIDLVAYDRTDIDAVTRLAASHDVVIAQRLPVATMLHLTHTKTRSIYDLYVPSLLESLAYLSREPGKDAAGRFTHERAVEDVVLSTGSAFVCASERQRDYWLGRLAALGRLDVDSFATDPSGRLLVDVVPFGLDQPPPTREPDVALPGFGDGSFVLLWGGGIWNWLDPLTVIRAVSELSKRRQDVRLVFMGTQHPSEVIGEMAMAREAMELANRLGVAGQSVVFNEGWLPHDERWRWLSAANVGVSAHFADLETRYAYRTRMLDYLAAGLPILTTRGDHFGDLVSERGLGLSMAAGDVDGWVEAIELLRDDREKYQQARAAVAAARSEHAWTTVVRPLFHLVERSATPPRPRRPELAKLRTRELVSRARLSVGHRGVIGAGWHAIRRGW
jgi:glycosyltransferase involved in cell wall biosynthesis